MAFSDTESYRSGRNDSKHKWNNEFGPQQRVRQHSINYQLNPRNLVEIEANGNSVIALVDTGAHVSCVSQDFLTNAGRVPPPKYNPTIGSVQSFSGSKVPVLGSIIVDINLRNISVKHNMYVFEHMHHPIILGLDFLKQHSGEISITHDTVSFHQDRVKLPLVSSIKTALFRNIKSVTIPAKSETDVLVKTSRIPTSIALIEQCRLLPESFGLGAARTLCLVHKQKATLRILNPTDQDVYIHKGIAIAKSVPFYIHSVTPIRSEIEDRSNVKNSRNNVDDVIKELGLVLEGDDLNEKQIEANREKFGYNELPAEEGKSLWALIGNE